MTRLLLAAVADDLSGACDLAESAHAAGLATVVVLGVPVGEHDDADADAQCIVVAVKSRTADPDRAQTDSAAAAEWLLGREPTLLYQKYCSTFDSTDRGNIGPVADALARVAGGDDRPGGRLLSVGTPATPAAGRTQYLGHLFVGRRLLSESSLRDHPLTPMRDPDLVGVLGRQTEQRVELVELDIVRRGSAAVRDRLAGLASSGVGHVLVDATSDADLDVLADSLLPRDGAPGDPFVASGAAGLGRAVALRMARDARAGDAADPHGAPLTSPAAGGRLIVSGSSSARSREQAAAFRGRAVWFDPLAVARGEATLEMLHAEVGDALRTDPQRPVLFAPVGADAPSADLVRAVQAELGVSHAAAVVEGTVSAVAARAVADSGVRRIIVAGGETSGAVAAALGVCRLRVGRSAAPGVPWMVAATRDGTAVGLLLKPGNFGAADLFTTAWKAAP